MTVSDDNFLSLVDKIDKFVFITIFFKFFFFKLINLYTLETNEHESVALPTIYRVFGKFQRNLYKIINFMNLNARTKSRIFGQDLNVLLPDIFNHVRFFIILSGRN
jgi:hypothetical protein